MAEQEVLDTSFKQMSNAQKTALLFIALGQKWATGILRSLRAEEVRKISYWINHISYVPQEVTEQVIREFHERLAKKTSLATTGGADYLLDVLGNIMGESKAQDLIDELSDSEEHEVFRILRVVDPRQLAAFLKQEQPQTVSLMLSYLDAQRASAIIEQFPEEVQVDIVTRMANLEETDQDVIAAMERSLNQSLGGMMTGKKMKKVGGPKAVAEILNNLDGEAEKAIMEVISEKDFDLAAQIKDLMFTFADIILLDDKSIQTVLKDVEQPDLVLALKGANDAVKEKVFGNISKRQADTIEDELSFMGPVKSSTVQGSQQKVVNIIRKLDEEGKILIQGKGGGDDIIA